MSRRIPAFKPLDGAAARLIPAKALVPLYRGSNILNVFTTGGAADSRCWRRATLDGAGHFLSLADAGAACERAGGYLASLADCFVYVQAGGLFDH